MEAGRDGRIVEVLADGFVAGDRVLRKAGVVVGRAPRPEPAGEERSAAGTGSVCEPDSGRAAESVEPARSAELTEDVESAEGVEHAEDVESGDGRNDDEGNR
nr:hypothetical protein GCM10020093_111610 [Planobispora longispora]